MSNSNGRLTCGRGGGYDRGGYDRGPRYDRGYGGYSEDSAPPRRRYYRDPDSED